VGHEIPGSMDRKFPAGVSANGSADLEPNYKVEVLHPDDFTGAVMSELQSRTKPHKGEMVKKLNDLH
jgi:translation elongation factor EF-G